MLRHLKIYLNEIFCHLKHSRDVLQAEKPDCSLSKSPKNISHDFLLHSIEYKLIDSETFQCLGVSRGESSCKQ